MAAPDVAAYCRAVETHLTRVNGGHLVRVVGPAFELVRRWQMDGVPLSVVERAIEQKAERHRQGTAGRTGRALRIEFCEDDVRQLFEDWKRATGVMSIAADADERARPVEEPDAPRAEAGRKPPLSRHLDRVSERLTRLLGRSDRPDEFLAVVNQAIEAVGIARERGKGARGAAREEIAAALRPLDRRLADAAWRALDEAARGHITLAAEDELAPFRDRLPPQAWRDALQATTDRLVRAAFELPVVDPDAL